MAKNTIHSGKLTGYELEQYFPYHILKFQSTNDLNSSLYFKYVDTDYESLNDVDVLERMSMNMLLIKMRGNGCTEILRKSRQPYMTISILYSFCCGF